MTHKLLFEASFQREGPFVKFMSPIEVIRGTRNPLTIKITNLSDRAFPGGIFTKLMASQPVGMVTLDSDLSALGATSCEPIPPKSSVNYSFPDFIVYQEGLGWFTVAIAAKDNESIEYYQSMSGPPNQAMWQGFFHVLNKEALMIVGLLQEMVSSLKEGKKSVE